MLNICYVFPIRKNLIRNFIETPVFDDEDDDDVFDDDWAVWSSYVCKGGVAVTGALKIRESA